MIKPGIFSPLPAAADARRFEFDIKNECLLVNETPIDFVFIGDSITALWELDAFFQSDKGALINRGIGGDSAQYVGKRFEADALQLKPKHIVLKIGVNDTFKMDATLMASRELWKPEVVVKHVTEEIEQIAKLCKEHGQSLIMCSILPTSRPLSPANEIRNGIIIEMNEMIRNIADSHGFIYVDYHTQFVDTDGKTIRDGLADDGVHPHIGGYEVMARVLSETLQKAGITLALQNK